MGLLDEVDARLDVKAAARNKLARQRPRIRMWANPTTSNHDGLVLRGEIAEYVSFNCAWGKNEPASATLKLRNDHHLANWLKSIPDDPDAKKNVVLTADFYGGQERWSGIMSHWSLIKDSSGIRYLEVTFIDDLQYLAFLLCPPNPALPIPVFQFPRVLPIFGPTRWAVSTLLLLNVMRVEGNWWTLPDDPFDWYSWTDSFDMTEWQCHIKATPLLSDQSLWTMFGVRMDAALSAIGDALDDAQQVLTYRRILTVDGETPADVGMGHLPSMRNGALVLSVEDRSGYYGSEGTFFGGNILDGFTRSVVTFGEGWIDSQFNVITDDQTLAPDEYYTPGFFKQKPQVPWIIIRDSKYSQMDTANVTWSPATATSVIVGGANPYADMIAKVTIEAVGNLLGYFYMAGFSSAGTIAADVIMPFLQGCIAAWLQWEMSSRAQQLGWVHLWEVFQQGGDSNAWSLSAIAALRAGFLATRSKTSHTFTLGVGPIKPGFHFGIGERVGSTFEAEFGPKIFVDHVESMEYSIDYSSDEAGAWQITCGKNENGMEASERAARQLEKFKSVLQGVGVRLLA